MLPTAPDAAPAGLAPQFHSYHVRSAFMQVADQLLSLNTPPLPLFLRLCCVRRRCVPTGCEACA